MTIMKMKRVNKDNLPALKAALNDMNIQHFVVDLNADDAAWMFLAHHVRNARDFNNMAVVKIAATKADINKAFKLANIG